MISTTTEQVNWITIFCFSFPCLIMGCVIGAFLVIVSVRGKVEQMVNELNEYKNKYGKL